MTKQVQSVDIIVTFDDGSKMNIDNLNDERLREFDDLTSLNVGEIIDLIDLIQVDDDEEDAND